MRRKRERKKGIGGMLARGQEGGMDTGMGECRANVKDERQGRKGTTQKRHYA